MSKVVHFVYLRRNERSACGVWRMNTTHHPGEVTCARCWNTHEFKRSYEAAMKEVSAEAEYWAADWRGDVDAKNKAASRFLKG